MIAICKINFCVPSKNVMNFLKWTNTIFWRGPPSFKGLLAYLWYFYFLAALRSMHRGSIVIARKIRPPTFDGFTRFVTPQVQKSVFFYGRMYVCVSVCLSVSLCTYEILGSTGPIRTKFGLWEFFMNISRRFFYFLNKPFF